MRIGMLTYGLDRNPTGIGRYAVELITALARLPNAPEIVLLSTERADPHGLWRQFEFHRLPGCHLLPNLLSLGNLALSVAIKRHRLNLVHDPNGIAPFFGPAFGARRVVTIHDAFAYVYPQTHNRLDNWRYRGLLPAAARRADAVITDSKHSQGDLVRYLKISEEHVQVISCGLGASFAPQPDHATRRTTLARYGITSPYIFYVGGLNARKNLARLFAAYARLREQRPDMQLVIGGKRQWQTAEMDAALHRLDLGSHIHFTGYIADADLPALYSTAELFVFPSLYEGFGLPPLEAMACGTPVVTSNVSSLPEVVGDAALTVDPYDVEALAAAMAQVIADPAMAAELRRKGLERASQFTWERTARETLAIYEQVLEHPSTPALTGVPGAL